jgi:hypothetical protein
MPYINYDVIRMFSLFDFGIDKNKSENRHVWRLRRPYTRLGYYFNKYINVRREQLYL